MPGPVNHEAQESNLREWCNAPSANELWSQIWSNQFNLNINFNSTTIKGGDKKQAATHSAYNPLKIIQEL
jgi:hypothetical protein